MNNLTREEFDLLVSSAEKNKDMFLPELEDYRVKRAIFIAAGQGTRLKPITINTPKPLVRVNGERIIDSLIDAALAVDIEEIIIVRGYLGEQFEQLLYKYPMIKFLDNKEYLTANNISSAICAKDLFSNAYVFEADLLISNPKVLKKYHYSSNFLGIKVEQSDDWCFEVDKGIIQKQMIGGKNCYQMVGISYWNDIDGRAISKDLTEAYSHTDGKELYWEQVPLKIFRDNYEVEISECSNDDVVEIDTFEELQKIDINYCV